MKNGVFSDVMPCGCCKNRSFGGMWHLHHQGDIVFLHKEHWLLVTADVVPSAPILVTLMMKSLCSSETSVLTRSTLHTIPEDAIFSRSKFEACYLLLLFPPWLNLRPSWWRQYSSLKCWSLFTLLPKGHILHSHYYDIIKLNIMRSLLMMSPLKPMAQVNEMEF
jgi:hypothetical protein